MDRATAARIQEWDERPISGGYSGLRELADASFTGAVTNGSAWLYLLNGRIVSTIDGTVQSFEEGEAKAYEAPDPGLPLLYAMQAEGEDPRAKYYTDDNPLPEVHETLAEAGFTGYIELSENVLSGDYYVVYYGGKSMSVAFVGNSERLLTGDEAFREAADEVGIYEVVDVQLDVRNVPEPTEEEAGAAGTAVLQDDASATEPAEPTPDPQTVSANEDPGDASQHESEPQPEEAPEPEEPEPEPDPEPAPQTAEPNTANTANETTSDPAANQTDPFSQEAAWRETRTIPALDPEESEPPRAAEDGGHQTTAVEQRSESTPAEPKPEPETPEPSSEEPDDDRIAELEAAIEAQSETIAELESRLNTSTEEIQQLRDERDTLESELESARSGADPSDSVPSGERLDRNTALDQTDLFVRYDTQGGGTLEKAHDDRIDREEVVSNLRIDHHTRFEADEVSVEGQPYRTFLPESLEYRFVNWLVTELLFEIKDTGSQRGLREVFDAIPRIDRAEFLGQVTWRDQDDGETHSESFDVVCRDRMGQALIVANLNDSRDPATAEMMESLIEGTSTIAEGTETLGGAFMVTSSFFRPDALETASEATGGGLLSREKRWSYVKLSRRHGFHLSLVEARGDDFHVAVPEL